jgi:hypothetical protein
MRWRLLIEEYGPTLDYVKGVTNVVADALSHLNLSPSVVMEADPSKLDHPSSCQLAEAFALMKEDFLNTCPLTLKTLMREQQERNKDLLKRAQSASGINLRSFHGGRKIRQLLVEGDKIIVPTSLQKPIVEWCYVTPVRHEWKTRSVST